MGFQGNFLHGKVPEPGFELAGGRVVKALPGSVPVRSAGENKRLRCPVEPGTSKPRGLFRPSSTVER